MAVKINTDAAPQVTFKKRRNGIIKKAYELSILCGCEIALVIFDSRGKLYQYGSHGTAQTLLKYADTGDAVESITNKSIEDSVRPNIHCQPQLG